MTQAQVRRCVRCCGVNRGALVGLLPPYAMEAKEHCIDLLDMRLVPPAFNVDVISVSVASLLQQIILNCVLESDKCNRTYKSLLRKEVVFHFTACSVVLLFILAPLA
jgi:hypothetical protein